MAASQARYLALTARKSNCEFQGQQINQSRLLLSNQSANLFNQMLGLSVPVPPSVNDFTKVQYSYSDGATGSTIDSWKQIPNDPDYNYVVTHHYYTDVYTGSQKQLSDPQVQVSVGQPASQQEIYEALKVLTEKKEAFADAQSAMDSAKAMMDTKLAAISVAQDIAAAKKAVLDTAQAQADIAVKELDDAQKDLKDVTKYQKSNTEITSLVEGTTPGTYIVNGTNTYTNYENLSDADKTKVKNAFDSMFANGAITDENAYLNWYYDSSTNTIAFGSDISQLIGKTEGKLPVYGAGDVTDADSVSYKAMMLKNAEITAEGNNTYTQNNLQNAQKAYDDATKSIETAQSEYTQSIIDYNNAVSEYNQANNEYDTAKGNYDGLSKPTYVGNSPLTPIEELDSKTEPEIRQIVKDMTDQEITCNIRNCFDAAGNYTGGIYSFNLNGKTYFTTYADLMKAYDQETASTNKIDGQIKLPYYSAGYVSTKIEKTERALMETDGTGRFTSARFENDSITYTLKTETITDDAAYQDAMNQYYYENAKYDKTVQDINAKTSLIQQEDQQLELRLKQLDTEQNALKTEMDAVSKIVKDNVENTFKTFGG